jgi:hypothetical protein
MIFLSLQSVLESDQIQPVFFGYQFSLFQAVPAFFLSAPEDQFGVSQNKTKSEKGIGG